VENKESPGRVRDFLLFFQPKLPLLLLYLIVFCFIVSLKLFYFTTSNHYFSTPYRGRFTRAPTRISRKDGESRISAVLRLAKEEIAWRARETDAICHEKAGGGGLAGEFSTWRVEKLFFRQRPCLFALLSAPSSALITRTCMCYLYFFLFRPLSMSREFRIQRLQRKFA